MERGAFLEGHARFASQGAGPISPNINRDLLNTASRCDINAIGLAVQDYMRVVKRQSRKCVSLGLGGRCLGNATDRSVDPGGWGRSWPQKICRGSEYVLTPLNVAFFHSKLLLGNSASFTSRLKDLC